MSFKNIRAQCGASKNARLASYKAPNHGTQPQPTVVKTDAGGERRGYNTGGVVGIDDENEMRSNKKSGKTTVNVIVSPAQSKNVPQPVPVAAPTPPPPMPPMPPVGGPGMPPPGMPMRKHGGRVKGGK